MANACKLCFKRWEQEERNIEMTSAMTKLNWKTTRQWNLQYVNNDNCWHNLHVVHILISIEHLTQFLCIFNVPWQFDVLSLRPKQKTRRNLPSNFLRRISIFWNSWMKLTLPIWGTLDRHKTLRLGWLKRCQSIWKWIFSLRICHWRALRSTIWLPGRCLCILHSLCYCYNYCYQFHYQCHWFSSHSGYL